MKELKLSIPADFKFVPGVRTCISRISSSFGFDDRETYQIELVVDEICNNAIEHGSKNPSDVVEASCTFDRGYMKLRVKDAGGEAFNVEEILSRNIEQASKTDLLHSLDQRGRGLIIVRKLVDRLHIKVGEDGTIVEIEKSKRDPEQNG